MVISVSATLSNEIEMVNYRSSHFHQTKQFKSCVTKKFIRSITHQCVNSTQILVFELIFPNLEMAMINNNNRIDVGM